LNAKQQIHHILAVDLGLAEILILNDLGATTVGLASWLTFFPGSGKIDGKK